MSEAAPKGPTQETQVPISAKMGTVLDGAKTGLKDILTTKIDPTKKEKEKFKLHSGAIFNEGVVLIALLFCTGIASVITYSLSGVVHFMPPADEVGNNIGGAIRVVNLERTSNIGGWCKEIAEKANATNYYFSDGGCKMDFNGESLPPHKINIPYTFKRISQLLGFDSTDYPESFGGLVGRFKKIEGTTTHRFFLGNWPEKVNPINYQPEEYINF
jgi:hypothetical protein